MVLLEVFSAKIWLSLDSFRDIDTDADGVLQRSEVEARVTQIYGAQVADLVLDNIMGVADMNNDGTITPLEMMIV